MFGRKKPAPLDISPETDAFLKQAIDEYNQKLNILKAEWSFDSYESWGFDQPSGLFFLQLKDGKRVEADGQILGSYFATRGNWEWAWNNPNVLDGCKTDSLLVKKHGEALGISYLTAPIVPVPNELFATYLAAIGVKVTQSQGVYPGNAGPLAVYIMLKNFRKRG